jgi:hypothetical protein
LRPIFDGSTAGDPELLALADEMEATLPENAGAADS